MSEMQAVRGVKRSAPKSDADAGKRRVPYVVRACDACRKRKGRCCGRQPCEHCAGRNQPCHFSPLPNEWRSGVVNTEPSQVREVAPPPPLWWSPEAFRSLEALVANLQDEVSSLGTQIKNKDRNSVISPLSSASDSNTLVETQRNEISAALGSAVAKGLSKSCAVSPMNPSNDSIVDSVVGSKFYGPTSPDFGLNIAQLKIRKEGYSDPNINSGHLASIDDNQSDGEEANNSAESERRKGLQYQTANPSVFEKLLQFRNYFSRREAIQALLVYQDVVGMYHPILHIDTLVRQVKHWYTWPIGQYPPRLSSVDEHDMLKVNLAITISLCIESTVPGFDQAKLRDKIYASCQELLNSKITQQSADMKNVVILILVGFYSFYKDELRYAWRMCGLAGHILMELGFHKQNVARQILSTDQEWVDYMILATSIVVLDRQWSAAIGLPNNFSNLDFELELESLASFPYLKAMMSFVTISDKFNEHSLRAMNGGRYDDDDQFGVMNFQIEQWQKKAIGSYNFQQVCNDQSASNFPPAWAILIYLRANAVRAMLLRPFFFSNTSIAASSRNIRPGLDLITESIDMLSVLDQKTDIYRSHHPCFQHLLVTSCELMFLIVVHVEQNCLSLSSADNFPQSLRRNYKKACALASAYSKSSRASRRLYKRLRRMEQPFSEAGLLSADDLGIEKGEEASLNVLQQPNKPNRVDRVNLTSRYLPADLNDPPPASIPTDFEHEYSFAADPYSTPSSLLRAGELDTDWAVPLSEEWGINSPSGLFWGI